MNYTEALKVMYSSEDRRRFISDPFLMFSFLSDLTSSSAEEQKITRTFFLLNRQVNVFELIEKDGIENALNKLVPYWGYLRHETDILSFKACVRGAVELFEPDHFKDHPLQKASVNVIIRHDTGVGKTTEPDAEKPENKPIIVPEAKGPSSKTLKLNADESIRTRGTDKLIIKALGASVILADSYENAMRLNTESDKKTVNFTLTQSADGKTKTIEVIRTKHVRDPRPMTLVLKLDLSRIKCVEITTDSPVQTKGNMKELKIIRSDSADVHSDIICANINSKHKILLRGKTNELKLYSESGPVIAKGNGHKVSLMAMEGDARYYGDADDISVTCKKGNAAVHCAPFAYVGQKAERNGYKILHYMRKPAKR